MEVANYVFSLIRALNHPFGQHVMQSNNKKTFYLFSTFHARNGEISVWVHV